MRNYVQLKGNLGGEVELTDLKKDQCVANFSLATNEVINRGKKNEKTLTDWHSVKAWNQLARAIAEQLKKGDYVSVEGKLRTDNYETTAGDKRKITYVLASTVEKVNSVLAAGAEKDKEKPKAKKGK